MTQVITKDGFVADIWADTPAPLPEDHAGERAITLPVDQDPATLAERFEQLDLIVIPFASSADGRGFSLAAVLRDLGYRGHIRAQGHVLVDQFRAAMRAGFTDIAISDDQAARNPEHQWLSVPFDAAYQSRVFA